MTITPKIASSERPSAPASPSASPSVSPSLRGQPFSPPMTNLLALAHRIGAPGDLAILGEGNVSERTDDDHIMVKSSGTSLETLSLDQLTECRLKSLLAVLDHTGTLSDHEVDQKLLESRVNSSARKPSVEAFFHAYLLTLPGIRFVAHCHPDAVNAILCSPHAQKFATQRHCPDEVVCCGSESLFIPYIDPGLALAREIRTRLRAFVERTGKLPKVILLGNHGVICPASTAAGAWAALAMTVKAARVYLASIPLGGPVPLPPADIARLDARPDEDYRRAVLGI